jgi:hypothetical protein
MAIVASEDEDRHGGREMECKGRWHIGEGDGVLFGSAYGIKFSPVDRRTFPKAVRDREFREVRGRPAVDRYAMEFDPSALDQDRVGREIDEYIGLWAGGEFDLLFQHSGSFVKCSGIVGIPGGKDILFASPAH